jgi:glycosyltransferase involved in cell wall biosynthesis
MHESNKPQAADRALPLVSVVTPVYNGEKYLVECIESVLAQSYRNWEYIIVDNCSSDNSLEIARQYQTQDSRIKIVMNDHVLPLMQNWNHALRQISPESKYCKMVHADDWLFPECIKSMVELAEKKTSVGIVGAYRIDEDHVTLDDLPYSISVLSGRDVCSKRIKKERHDLFGSPTSVLYRADLIRSRVKFYNEDYIHADTEVCFELLQNLDFGLVHQVLTYTRRHNESESSFTRIVNTHKFNHLYLTIKYGPIYLDKQEYKSACKRQWKIYYRALGKHLITLMKKGDAYKRKQFWEFHRSALSKMGYELKPLKMLGSVLVVFYNEGLRRLSIS